MAGFFVAAEDFFVRAAEDPALRERGVVFPFAFAGRVFGRDALVAFFLPRAAVFVLRVFTPSRECRMMGLRFGRAALRAGLRVAFFMIGSPSPGS
ncbi:MAG: hypothetical protein ABR610_17305 [Thermoanaerobaculia bacterium]